MRFLPVQGKFIFSELENWIKWQGFFRTTEVIPSATYKHTHTHTCTVYNSDIHTMRCLINNGQKANVIRAK